MNILGIDIGGSGIKGAPVNIVTGELTAERHRIPTPRPATPDAIGNTVLEIARYFDWHGPIGCAFPARIKHGIAHTASNIHHSWIDTHVTGLLKEKTGCPVVVLNDADAAGVAEVAFGAGRGCNDLIFVVTVGTGIGSALFIDQTLVPNTELGHLSLNGKNAEKHASDRTRKDKDLSWKEWAKRFQDYLGFVEFLFAPDLIIVGGGISRPNKWEKYAHLLKTEAELKTAELQNEAGIIGAAYSARVL